MSDEIPHNGAMLSEPESYTTGGDFSAEMPPVEGGDLNRWGGVVTNDSVITAVLSAV